MVVSARRIGLGIIANKRYTAICATRNVMDVMVLAQMSVKLALKMPALTIMDTVFVTLIGPESIAKSTKNRAILGARSVTVHMRQTETHVWHIQPKMTMDTANAITTGAEATAQSTLAYAT